MALVLIESTRARICGFCATNHHGRCAIGTRLQGPKEKYPDGAIWLCLCEEGGCELGRRKCSECNNRVTGEVNPETWKCFDQEACKDLIEARREANPLLVELREAKERAEMAKVVENKEKAAKVEKTKEPTFCLVTGKPTKGGKFLPGMDARYVSERVADVVGKVRTEAQAKKQMKDDGVSETLIAKFEKSLAIKRAKAEKDAAAAKAKADAKAEKAAASKG